MISANNQTRLFYEHASKLLVSSTIEEIAEHCIDIMENVINADISDFMVIEGKVLKNLITRPELDEMRLPLDGPGITVKAASTGKPELVNDLELIDYYVPGSLRTRSELVVPIIVDKQVYGVLNIEDTKPNNYTKHTLDLMEALASQVAIAVKSLKRFQGIKSIQSYTRDFIRQDSFTEIAELTFNVLSATIDVFYGSFHVVEGDTIHEMYTVGTTLKPFHQHIESRGVIPRAYRTKETQIIDDVTHDPDYNDEPVPEGVHIHSELAVPVIHENKVIAVLNLEDPNIARFTIDDKTIVEIIADIISAWHENKLLMEKNLSNQEIETRYRNLFELTPIAIMIFTSLGFVSSCNQATLELTGYTLDFILGKHLSELSTFSSNTSALLLNKMMQVVQGDRVDRLEFEFTRMDGSECWGVAYGRPITKASGVHDVLVMVEDITETKRRDEEKILYEAQIAEQKVRAEHAMEMDRMKTNFVSTATHEIRTPLTSIVGYMDLIEEAITKKDLQLGLTYFETLKRNVNRLSLITDNLLDLQRFQKNRVEIHNEKVSIPELIDEALKEIAPLNKNKKLRIHSYIRVYEPEMCADRIRINQVLINLLNNAIKFSPEESTASITVEEDELCYIFSVADKGIGLSPGEIGKLFEPFPDIDPVVKGKGTGIGLSICKGNVELHGGTIWAESPGEGKGSTFHFTIPKP